MYELLHRALGSRGRFPVLDNPNAKPMPSSLNEEASAHVLQSGGTGALMVGVLQVDRDPWAQIHRLGQKVTWMHNPPKGVQLVNIYGSKPNLMTLTFDKAHEGMRWDSRTSKLLARFDQAVGRLLKLRFPPAFSLQAEGDLANLRVMAPDCLFTIPVKEYAAFQYFLDASEAQYLYLTNTSSYVNLIRLLSVVEGLPSNRVYGGTMIGKKVPFASGANRIMSRDVVQTVLDNFIEKWDFRYLDDLALGLLLRNRNLHHARIPSLEIRSVKELRLIGDDYLKAQVHFRLKGPSSSDREDWIVMRALHQRLIGNPT